jgi:hypothetical protein
MKRENKRPLPVNLFFRKHGLVRGDMEELVTDPAFTCAPWSDETADVLGEMIGVCEPDVYATVFAPDVTAAINDRDIPRLARCAFHVMIFYLAKGASRKVVEYAEQEKRERDAGTTLNFDIFCMRWHEVGGTITERARHVEKTEGGQYRNHIIRYYRNREDVDALAPS